MTGPSKEQLEEIEAPQGSVGAPLPHVVTDEQNLFIAYLVEEHASSFDSTNPRTVAPDDDTQTTAIIEAIGYRAILFGPPNDEAISGHRLYKLGLRPYSSFEVLNSGWVAALEKANRVHQHHRPESFAKLRHFIFTFHDSTVEFIATRFNVKLYKGPVRRAAADALATW